MSAKVTRSEGKSMSLNPLIDRFVKVEVTAKHRLSVQLLSNEVLSAELEVRDVDLDGDADVSATVMVGGKVVFDGVVDLGEIDLSDAHAVLESLVGIVEGATGVDVPGIGRGK